MMACLKFTLNGKETDVIGKCYEYKNQIFTTEILFSGDNYL